MRDTHLYIVPHCVAKPKAVEYNVDGCFYDRGLHICVLRVHLAKKLKEGRLYDFTYVPVYASGEEDEDDANTYEYVVLKQAEEDVYYITEYYGKFIHVKETQLAGDRGVFVDLKQDLGIDLSKFKVEG